MVGCLALAHNHRIDAVARAKVLLNLGREARLGVEAMRQLIGSISRYLKRADGFGQWPRKRAAGFALRLTPLWWTPRSTLI